MDCTSDTDLEAFGAETYSRLYSGDIQVRNDDSSYQCPFCSDGKNDYNVHDLLQHAMNIEAAQDRQAKEKVNHRALAKHLRHKHAKSLGPLVQPMLKDSLPPQHNRDKLFVWPWMGVIVNMPVEYVGKSANRLKDHFSSFHPVKVYHVYSKGFPIGNAIVEFGKDWGGFRNAHIFERQFATKGCGKKGWKEKEHKGPEPFGWIARADDYNSPGAVGEHLRKNGDLKTAEDVGNEEPTKTYKLVTSLASVVGEKNIQLEKLESEYEKRTVKLDKMMKQREEQLESYNQEIQKMQELSHRHTEKIGEENKKLQMDLQSMMHELDARTKQLNELAKQAECDRRILELEKRKNAMKSEHIRLAALEQQKAEENVLKLVEQHKKEKDAALSSSKLMNKHLHGKHTLQLEIQHLLVKLQVIQLKSGDEQAEPGKTIDELREELVEKNNELKDTEALHDTLIVKEKMASVELQDARKVIIDALQGLPSPTGKLSGIGIRRIGELDLKAFSKACRKKFSKEYADVESAILCSKWQNEIENSEVIGEDDLKLQQLKAEYGKEVYDEVTKVMIELNEHKGSSSRHPFLELWNYDEGRKAKTIEVIQHVITIYKESRERKRRH